MNGITISDATHRWVNEFNRFPQDMISKLMSIEIDSWREVTKPSPGRRVYVYNLPEEKPDGTPYEGTEKSGEISECIDEDTYIVELDDGESVMVKEDDLELAVARPESGAGVSDAVERVRKKKCRRQGVLVQRRRDGGGGAAMIDLKEALKLTHCKDDDVTFLRRMDSETEIISVADIRKKYDIRKIKVIGIKPKFLCGNYSGIEFEIKEVLQ